MILTPSVLALTVVSVALTGVASAAAAASAGLLARWHPDDDGEAQLRRERRLLLIETALGGLLWIQLISLLAFVWVADRLHPLLPGAMCAAGSLAAGRAGYPLLGVKVAAFLLAGLWWLVHRESPGALSSGLVRIKHLSLSAVACVLVAEVVLQVRYFSELAPDVLTSCCATIFRAGPEGVGSRLAAIAPGVGQGLFFGLLGATVVAGAPLLRRAAGKTPPERRVLLFSAFAMVTGAAAVVAVVSWVAPAHYEAPTHHCPFCLLAAEQGWVGYPLYAALGTGVLAGAGAGAVRVLRRVDPLGALRPGAEARLCRRSIFGYFVFASIALWPLVVSGLRVGGP